MAVASYTLWGVFPVYFYWLRDVSAVEILAHRIWWSLLLLLAFGLLTGNYPWQPILASRAKLWRCFLSAVLLSVNWLIYIWAVANSMALEGSLGYFINPLVSVLLAVVILNEGLSRLQLVAIAMACVAVVYMIISLGEFPWVALSLAVAFGSYGLIHKRFKIDAIGGLTVETMLMAPFAIAYLVFLQINGQMSFLHTGIRVDLLLICAGPVTTVPLLLYLKGLSQLRLSTAALLQYLVPSIQFVVAIYILKEPLSSEKLIAFVIIWAGLLLFSIDIIRTRFKNNRLRASR